MRRVFVLALAIVAASCHLACGGGDAAPSEGGRAHRETGEESIEKFGSEATGADKEAILSVERAYLEALGRRDYDAACAYLGDQVQSSLQQLASKRSGLVGCAEILPKLLAPSAPAVASRQAVGKVSKVRVEGDRAFVIFHAPGAKLYVFTMMREDGAWKVTTVGASILVPSPAALG